MIVKPIRPIQKIDLTSDPLESNSFTPSSGIVRVATDGVAEFSLDGETYTTVNKNSPQNIQLSKASTGILSIERGETTTIFFEKGHMFVMGDFVSITGSPNSTWMSAIDHIEVIEVFESSLILEYDSTLLEDFDSFGTLKKSYKITTKSSIGSMISLYDVSLSGSSLLSPKSISSVFYNYYVNSIGGNDINDGLTPETAFASLGAAETAALSHGNGVRIALARGSEWRERLDLATLDAVTVDAYGDAAANPIIHAGDIYEGPWEDSTDRDDAHTNVYSVEWTHTAATASSVTVLEDGEMLRTIGASHALTSLADCQDTPGSYYSPVADSSATQTTVYVHPHDSTNPNTDGKVYEIAARNDAIRVGHNAVISGLSTRHNLHDSGSMNLNEGPTVRRSFVSWGTNHLAINRGDASFVDCIFRASYQKSAAGGTSFVVTFNSSTGIGGKETHFRRCGWIWGRDLTQTAAVLGFAAHAPDSSDLALVTMEGCWSRELESSLMGGGADELRVLNCYSRDRRAVHMEPSDAVIVRRLQWHNDVSQVTDVPVNRIGHALTLEDSVGRNVITSSRGFFEMPAGANSIVARRCAWVTTQNRPFAVGANIDGGSQVNESNVIYGHPGAAAQVITTTSQAFTADHNIYWFPGATQMRGRFDGTNHTTLAAWQAASGQDANSVYLTDAQAATFWLGDPAEGDFRINPNAEVTDAAGNTHVGQFPDGTPITQAGPQTHYDWNTRAVVAGPPERWPIVPESEADCAAYTRDPEGWNFYPT